MRGMPSSFFQTKMKRRDFVEQRESAYSRPPEPAVSLITGEVLKPKPKTRKKARKRRGKQ